MRPSLAVKCVQHLLHELAPHLVEAGWDVELNDRIASRLGLCYYARKRIVLSEKFVLINNPQRIEVTGKHEIAHALVGPGHGHNAIWKQQAAALGIPPVRCTSEAVQTNQVPGKFCAVCPGCQRVYWFYRRPKYARRWCTRCGKDSGQLTVIPYTTGIVTTDYPGDLDDLIDEI